jgi:4-amino-4-deoxy-L-arabinose transferase-like glycosyltransferase
MKGQAFSFLFIIIFGLFLYLPFISGKEFQGEEGRRVLIALQMLESREYLLPQLFGEPYFNKPPLFNLALALFFKLTGDYSEFTARAFSALSVLLGALFLTFIGMQILKPPPPGKNQFLYLFPGLIFMTTPEVIDKALRAEIDAFYTLLITMALFGWFYGYEVKRKRYLGFIVLGFFLGLGVLTKTFQALVFFYLAFIPYLILQKRLKEFWGFPHLIGILTILLVFLLWAIPVSQKVGLKPFLSAWINEYLSSAKAQEMSFLQHLESFTLSALLGFAPWLFTFLTCLKRGFRNFLKENPLFYRLFLFSTLLFILSYLFHFLFPGARLRYMLPSVGGLVWVATLVFYYHLLRGTIFQRLKGFALLNVILSLGLFIYVFMKSSQVPYVFYLFLGGFLALNLFLSLKEKISTGALFFYLLFYVFLVKHLYVTFYYPLHQREMNYFRKAAFEIAELIPGKGELYLCQVIPHHLIYYLKYRYKLIPRVEYLKECRDLPEKSYILLRDKNLITQGERIDKIYPLEIRKKSYYLLLTR